MFVHSTNIMKIGSHIYWLA